MVAEELAKTRDKVLRTGNCTRESNNGSETEDRRSQRVRGDGQAEGARDAITGVKKSRAQKRWCAEGREN